ncbi:DUF1360 domain-containing protein [Streptomyces rubellomurinus]|uniref:DUF1360 domain-containing protein n=1 Tax=Streptomyces rubellomurinus (strain ATCC 31215) TaxID=359131 RepID=A0A0F2TLS7_STRR3|nr:DUF1360 domain-containing protein [Streptomyces rubellomurinus]KJS62687.1 hypothetical protein VM95_07740 [Streptomyces rubellomurinus]
MSGSTSAVGSSLRRERGAYEPEGDQPIGGYLAVMAAYLGCVGALTALARRTGRPLPTPGPWDVLLTAGAVHKLSRLVTKDPVTSPLRLPFTRFRGQAGPAELAEDVRGQGVRRAIGELVTCPFCTGLWISTGLTAGQVLAPEATRLVSSGLSALALSDLLHFARVGLQDVASR